MAKHTNLLRFHNTSPRANQRLFLGPWEPVGWALVPLGVWRSSLQGWAIVLFRRSEPRLLAVRTLSLHFQARLPGIDPRQLPAIPSRAASTVLPATSPMFYHGAEHPRYNTAVSSTGFPQAAARNPSCKKRLLRILDLVKTKMHRLSCFNVSHVRMLVTIGVS